MWGGELWRDGFLFDRSHVGSVLVSCVSFLAWLSCLSVVP